MKTTFEVGIQENNADKNIQIGIVTGYSNNTHTLEYQIFNLNKPIRNIGFIGVDDNQIFAIQIKSNFKGRYALAVYLDGINVSQKNGIHSLNEINEDLRCNYESHIGGKFIVNNSTVSTFYLNRYSQMNDENRSFIFTNKKHSGINEILLDDPTLRNRIDVYLWVESDVLIPEYNMDLSPMVEDEKEHSPIKIGAGAPTFKTFKTSIGLENPFYVGKMLFIYVDSKKLNHLGDVLKPVINDPMNKILKNY